MNETMEELDLLLKKGRHRKKHLYNTILRQMEFYFSDSNLSKDRFLSQLIQTDPYVDLHHFLTFNKIRKLTENIDDLRKAIKKSEILELSEDSEKIRRKTEIKVKENVDECTVYVEKINSDCNHDFLSSIFSDFGNVAYVSIPKYKHNHMNKGFAFVEFDNEEEAQNALTYFENIGCKMSSNINPEDLCSITSFIKENEANLDKETDDKNKVKKRKFSTEDEEDNPTKKLKGETENTIITDEGDGKKKKKKDNKKKNLIRELGLQVLSKQEWKKMRNCYLNSQRKKMKEVKMHLSKSKFSSKNVQDVENGSVKPIDAKDTEETPAKLEFIPGTIVKLKLVEPCQSDKKLKMDIKNASKDVKYIDVPFSTGSEEVFLRFSTNEAAMKFCNEDYPGTKHLLEGEEENEYWKKIENDRITKFSKAKKKQRGKDKLLKKAEKHLATHTRFDENE